jgi:hypothetical protein
VRTDGERTILSVKLEPGETALFTFDRSRVAAADSSALPWSTVADIDEWVTAVESWDAGVLQVITEDRGLGYVTREVRPTTVVSRLEAGTGALRPWKDIPEVGPDVSGVGEYVGQFSLEDRADGGRYLLDLGSTAGGLGSVQVNSAKARGFDTSRPLIDVTDDVKIGENSVTVRVASSLNNRLLARGYYDDLPDVFGHLAGDPTAMQTTTVHDHGLLGPVRVLREADVD